MPILYTHNVTGQKIPHIIQSLHLLFPEDVQHLLYRETEHLSGLSCGHPARFVLLNQISFLSPEHAI